MTLGECQNFVSFAGLRFALGTLESCCTPGCLLVTAMCYTIEKQPLRIWFWSTCLGLANVFGGMLEYGIGHLKGPLASWRYQLIMIARVFSSSLVWLRMP